MQANCWMTLTILLKSQHETFEDTIKGEHYPEPPLLGDLPEFQWRVSRVTCTLVVYAPQDVNNLRVNSKQILPSLTPVLVWGRIYSHAVSNVRKIEQTVRSQNGLALRLL